MFKYFLIALLVLSSNIGSDASYSIKNNHKVKDAINLIQIWMDAQKDYEEIPGISIAIVHNQELLWSGGFGFSNPFFWPTKRIRLSILDRS